MTSIDGGMKPRLNNKQIGDTCAALFQRKLCHLFLAAWSGSSTDPHKANILFAVLLHLRLHLQHLRDAFIQSDIGQCFVVQKNMLLELINSRLKL